MNSLLSYMVIMMNEWWTRIELNFFVDGSFATKSWCNTSKLISPVKIHCIYIVFASFSVFDKSCKNTLIMLRQQGVLFCFGAFRRRN